MNSMIEFLISSYVVIGDEALCDQVQQCPIGTRLYNVCYTTKFCALHRSYGLNNVSWRSGLCYSLEENVPPNVQPSLFSNSLYHP